MRAAVSPQRTEPVILPAPIGGINATANLMTLPPEDCISAYNYIPQTYGMEVRKGYQRVGYGFSGASDGVRTLIPFEGTDSTQDRLFACTLEGIYNVTTPATSYTTTTEGIAWASKTGDAGYCTYVVYTTPANKFLLVADEVNGLYMYTQSTGVWAAVTGLTGDIDTDGYDGDDVAFVTVWKQRVWLVLRDSGDAYYLDPGVVAGNATRFSFGNKFPTGGFLNSIYNFTMDGGNGPDDYLAALSSAGDVAIYQGTDPAAIETFNIVGIWNIGKLPLGRNLGSSAGGDLYVLCSMGLVSITQLLKGTEPGSLPAYITGKITPLVRIDVAANLNLRGWGVYSHPTDGVLFITIPKNTTPYTQYGQYVMNTTLRSWTRLLGLPMHTAASWLGRFFMGAKSIDSADKGSVFEYLGFQDDVPYGGGASGTPISASVLTTYQGKGNNIRLHFVKPQFLARGLPVYEVEARYDFDVDDQLRVLSGTIPSPLGTDWSDTWGTALWGDSELIPFAELKGVTGIGKFAAVSLTTKSNYQTVLVGFTGMADGGNLL